MSKFKVGDRVTGKHSHFTENSHRKYAVVIPSTDRYWVRVRFEEDGYEDGYKEVQLELVTKGDNKVKERRTFKLLKDLPDIKKGALFQEDCDDGTQPYSLFTKDSYKGSDISVADDIEFNDRKLVEDAPDWFVEVFKVTPQYMTQPEIDQWEAFKKTTVKRSYVKKPVAKKKAKATKKRKISKHILQTAELHKHGYSDLFIANELGVKGASANRYVAFAKEYGLL